MAPKGFWPLSACHYFRLASIAIAGLSCGKRGVAVLGIDAWVSLFGPAYFAYAGVTVPFMVAWAIACAALATWNNRESRRHGRLAPGIVASRSWAASIGIFVLVAACYIAAHSAVYLLVRHFVRMWL
ncbi:MULTISPECIES: hypothetical protein [unclassified Mesorhizobium]|uniref:hypothetical protein n=1 Tax=unclassified Mesorhizobium TaxID=325217 RepID=UPI001CCCC0A3|nr:MULTISPECIES: hypothetical protein [unclassified Mesorhizobium]MBZ9694551.1 hypothetical protein [Mesorhizobium sp. CO1-1-9]